MTKDEALGAVKRKTHKDHRQKTRHKAGGRTLLALDDYPNIFCRGLDEAAGTRENLL